MFMQSCCNSWNARRFKVGKTIPEEGTTHTAVKVVYNGKDVSVSLCLPNWL